MSYFEVIFCEKIVVRMKNVKFRGKRRIPWQFRGSKYRGKTQIPRKSAGAETVGPSYHAPLALRETCHNAINLNTQWIILSSPAVDDNGTHRLSGVAMVGVTGWR